MEERHGGFLIVLRSKTGRAGCNDPDMTIGVASDVFGNALK